MSITLKCSSLVLPDHAYTDCAYMNPEDMVEFGGVLGVDGASLVKRGTLVRLCEPGPGEPAVSAKDVVVFVKLVIFLCKWCSSLNARSRYLFKFSCRPNPKYISTNTFAGATPQRHGERCRRAVFSARQAVSPPTNQSSWFHLSRKLTL